LRLERSAWHEGVMRPFIMLAGLAVSVVASSSEARCRPPCSCPGLTLWAAQGRVVQGQGDGGSQVPLELEVSEVTNLGAVSPPQPGDRLPISDVAVGAQLLRLSGGATYSVEDGTVVCSGYLFPVDRFVQSLRSEAACRALLTDAGVLIDQPCNDVRCGCSGLPAGTGLAGVALLALMRRSARR
jgi:hypothetical protein